MTFSAQLICTLETDPTLILFTLTHESEGTCYFPKAGRRWLVQPGRSSWDFDFADGQPDLLMLEICTLLKSSLLSPLSMSVLPAFATPDTGSVSGSIRALVRTSSARPACLPQKEEEQWCWIVKKKDVTRGWMIIDSEPSARGDQGAYIGQKVFLSLPRERSPTSGYYSHRPRIE